MNETGILRKTPRLGSGRLKPLHLAPNTYLSRPLVLFASPSPVYRHVTPEHIHSLRSMYWFRVRSRPTIGVVLRSLLVKSRVMSRGRMALPLLKLFSRKWSTRLLQIGVLQCGKRTHLTLLKRSLRQVPSPPIRADPLVLLRFLSIMSTDTKTILYKDRNRPANP